MSRGSPRLPRCENAIEAGGRILVFRGHALVDGNLQGWNEGGAGTRA